MSTVEMGGDKIHYERERHEIFESVYLMDGQDEIARIELEIKTSGEMVLLGSDGRQEVNKRVLADYVLGVDEIHYDKDLDQYLITESTAGAVFLDIPLGAHEVETIGELELVFESGNLVSVSG